MDTLKKTLHPKQTLHRTDDETDFAATQTSAGGPPGSDPRRPNQQTRDALTSEPNVTGTDRPAPSGGEFPEQQHQERGQEQHARISRGHHHPRQPVGATGLPPNHRPRGEVGTGGAEEQNNFPGTNPSFGGGE